MNRGFATGLDAVPSRGESKERVGLTVLSWKKDPTPLVSTSSFLYADMVKRASESD